MQIVSCQTLFSEEKKHNVISMQNIKQKAKSKCFLILLTGEIKGIVEIASLLLVKWI